MDWTAGILGAVQGTSEAVTEVSRERIHQLAEHLKLQALEEIEKRSSAREHGQDVELQETDIQARKNLQETDIKSREGMLDKRLKSSEKIASEGNISREKIASDRDETMLKRDLLAAANKTEDKDRKILIGAYKVASEMADAGRSMQEINSMFRDLNISPWGIDEDLEKLRKSGEEASKAKTSSSTRTQPTKSAEPKGLISKVQASEPEVPGFGSGIGVLGKSVTSSLRGIGNKVEKRMSKAEERFEPGGRLFERDFRRYSKKYGIKKPSDPDYDYRQAFADGVVPRLVSGRWVWPDKYRK